MVGTAAVVLRADCARWREILGPGKGRDNILRAPSEKKTREREALDVFSITVLRELISVDTKNWMPNWYKRLSPGAWQYVIYSQHRGALNDCLLSRVSA